MAIVLIGFMGAGKSTAARELGAALGQEVFDSDELLAARFGHSIAEEFERGGEAAFRAAEEELVCELLSRAAPGDVVALGGGSVLSERVREALDTGHVTVLLDVDADTAWERLAANGAGPVRPLANDPEAFRALHGTRAELYEGLAAAFVGPLPEARLPALAPSLRALAALPRGARLLWASSASGDYPVLIGDGLLTDHGPELLAAWPLHDARSRAFCVSDGNVAARYGNAVGETALTIDIAPGERSKTLASAERVWTALLGAGMTRADHVIALGGGVVGDLAGFCAATYQRGVPVVQVPTTLVAQVDSAYGGKTGVDLPAAKNYIGAYHQPAGVLADPLALRTLPAEELAAGWVEVLKTALIAGGELWERVAAGAEPDAAIVFACARTKLAVVAADERDSGRRQVLNLGHTVGHAIETATFYERYRHGEAVGLGLLAALALSQRPELRAEVRELIASRGLPVKLEGVDVEAVIQALARDKKRTVTEDVPFVLVDAPGEVSEGHLVPREQVRAAVQELAS
ncbi:MAG TPA: bifunctional shikimate kinase/3-dehydroquinate synthase [Solirubrobacteraceae bacterium]|nr:bifunctional shikimate kinase/3-dehydroquinate synthase [Solirubrobacteraceae bacterium]